ncbi:hypothetical protein IAR55_002183 [Kwoniella newhampshirensis]|uniref:Bud22 domain-containing protein n=1 Tax=Kwoniella newhampshirensis TaxID=1651941 RepID=A0AAW0Z0T1_9TREE
MSDSGLPGVTDSHGKKRKRTGKEREEKKKAAILAQAQADSHATTAGVEPTADARESAGIQGETSAPPTIENVSEGEAIVEGAPAGKKRKRTGKEREERKKAFLLAQAEAAANPETLPSSITNDEPTTTAGALRPIFDLEKAATRIPQGLKTLHPVFKQAKSFETRRLIKKIKFLRTKNGSKEELADLEAQLQLIHQIQLHSLAQSHLFVKLRKHPLLKHLSLPESFTTMLTPTTPSLPTTSTSAAPALVEKVENRLCSAKLVADKVKIVVGWIVGEQGAKLSKAAENKAGSRATRALDDSEEEDEEDEDIVDDEDVAMAVPRALGEEEEEDVDIGSDDETLQQDHAADMAGWESGSVSGRDDDSEDGNDSDDQEDTISLPKPSNKNAKPTSTPAADSKARKTNTKTQTSTKEQTTNLRAADITTSLFLPSLATGFTRGDEGDSDPDDDYDPDGVIGGKTVVRKNRRGQRARQAIWEKKYGKGAKHVVKARQEEQEQARKSQEKAEVRARGRDSGWGARAGTTSLGATASASRPAPPHLATSNSTPTPMSTSAPAPARAPYSAPAQDKAAMHPSWEAARLRKQKMAMVPPVDGPKPNKIIFD